MRMSDWSSDVCSSDLHCHPAWRERVIEPPRMAMAPSASDLDHEEALRRWVNDALEVSVSLIGMQAGISGEAFEDELLAATRSHISRLFAFDAMDIVLVDEGDSGFHFATGEIGRASCRERVCQYV